MVSLLIAIERFLWLNTNSNIQKLALIGIAKGTVHTGTRQPLVLLLPLHAVWQILVQVLQTLLRQGTRRFSKRQSPSNRWTRLHRSYRTRIWLHSTLRIRCRVSRTLKRHRCAQLPCLIVWAVWASIRPGQQQRMLLPHCAVWLGRGMHAVSCTVTVVILLQALCKGNAAAARRMSACQASTRAVGVQASTGPGILFGHVRVMLGSSLLQNRHAHLLGTIHYLSRCVPAVRCVPSHYHKPDRLFGQQALI